MKRAVEWFMGLAPRERLMVGGGGLFALLTLVWLLVIDPAAESRELMRRRIVTKEAELAEVTAMAAEVRDLRDRLREAEAQAGPPSTDPPLTELERMATDAGIREKVTALSPAGSEARGSGRLATFRVELKGVTLGGLTRFLEAAASGGRSYRTGRVSLAPRFDDPSLLDGELSLLLPAGGDA